MKRTFGTAVAAYAVVVLGHAAAGVYWHVAVAAHRLGQLRPVCMARGHAFDLDLIECVRCGTRYNRVRDCR